MIAGAFHGSRQIPRRWTRSLAPALLDELSGHAAALIDLSPWGQ
jgi:hypothetical protein